MIDIGLGFAELIVIFTIALIVVGPERLPGLVRTVGRFVGRARRMAQAMQYELERELDVNDISGGTSSGTTKPDSAGVAEAATSNVTAHPKYGELPERAKPDADAPPEDPLDDDVPTEGHADDVLPGDESDIASSEPSDVTDNPRPAVGADRSG